MNILISLRSEILKTRKTASFYLAILAAIIFPLLLLLDVTIDGVNPDTRKDPFNVFITESFKAINLLILPMFIVLISTLLPQVEYRNNTWKQVFTSPQTFSGIFFAKFLNLQIFIVVFFIAFNCSVAISAVGIHFLEPSLNLLGNDIDWYQLWVYNVKTYLSAAGISALQFVIGMRFKNFILPIAIGFILWVIGALIVFEMPSALKNVFPFSYPTMIMFPDYKPVSSQIQWSSVGFAGVFLLLGYWQFCAKKIKV